MTDIRQALAEAVHLCEKLTSRAGEAHSLAYDRPGIHYDRNIRRGDPDRLPIRLTRTGEPTNHAAAADLDGAGRWQRSARLLAEADIHLFAALERLRVWRPPLQTGHIRRGVAPSPTFYARLAGHVRDGLELVGVDEVAGKPKVQRLLLEVCELVGRAHRTLGKEAAPRRPRKRCRNPRDRVLCWTVVDNKKRQLCRSCDQHERNLARRSERAS